MKKIIILVSFLLPFLCNAQNSFIVDKKGKKIVIRDNMIEIIADGGISYKLPGKTWEKFIKLKDLDYAILNEAYFKSFKINKKYRGYFVVAEEGNKKLAGTSVYTTYTRKSGNYSTTRLTVSYYVIENDNTMLFEVKATDYKHPKAIAIRKNIPKELKSYFPNCPKILERIDHCSKDPNDTLHTGILYLAKTSYINCN